MDLVLLETPWCRDEHCAQSTIGCSKSWLQWRNEDVGQFHTLYLAPISAAQPHTFISVVSSGLLRWKSFDSISPSSPVLLWETVGDHSMHGKVSLLRAKCAVWWSEPHCLCVRMIWGQCWSFNNGENKFISLCVSLCTHMWNEELSNLEHRGAGEGLHKTFCLGGEIQLL